IQGKYTAKTLSATEIVSDYQSVVNQQKSPLISFRFSINGKDNELPAGLNHSFYCLPGRNNETPLIKFGTTLINKTAMPAGQYLQPGTQLTVKVDMRDVYAAFGKQGFYTGADGDKIYAKDFKALYIAGNTAPLIWDVNNLVNDARLELKDTDGDHIYRVTLVLNETKADDAIGTAWKLTQDISGFPQYRSDYKISDAVYNMALQEMKNAVEPDSTFRTGKEWEGVWTRDISYSIILSMAILQPKVAMYSLMRKVKNGIIIQDTGTGGAYPISTDRMVWIIAAWEVYKVTGDKNWLHQVYEIAKKSAAADALNIYDTETGLVRGESSFLDWREQTYPVWMQPADIFESECLGTNVVHFRVNQLLSVMAGLNNDTAVATGYTQTAEKIRNGIQKHLWMANKGYYGQYLHGRDFKSLSPKSEALGAALAVFFEVDGKERQRAVVGNTPVTTFGIPCIYPQIPGILPYHNNGIWPFVESFWAMAAAQAGNERSLVKSIAAIYRPVMFFLTNKENFVAADGDFAGTQINSGNMLWSLSGNIALVYKVLF
ncbi:MAG: glycogen debranching protein, partial [Sphingobacteriaceae bacterium]